MYHKQNLHSACAEELQKIINFDTPIPRFERARDMFLFGCFTGLSYIDIKTLTAEHFERNPQGRIWIKKHRVKTGVLTVDGVCVFKFLFLPALQRIKQVVCGPEDIQSNGFIPLYQTGGTQP